MITETLFTVRVLPKVKRKNRNLPVLGISAKQPGRKLLNIHLVSSAL